MRFDSPMVFYFVYMCLLLLELFALYKGHITGTIGIGVGSLIHLFVLRAVLMASMSIALQIPMAGILQRTLLYSHLNLGSFALQIITLTLFIRLIPLDTLKRVMADPAFYRGLLGFALVCITYLIYHANSFLISYYSVNLAVQVIVAAVFALTFFYIMMLQLIRIFNLGVYKSKTAALEEQIDKDKVFASVALQFADVILEANCTKDKVTRVVLSSVERPTEHIPALGVLFQDQAARFTHPDDAETIRQLSAPYFLLAFAEGRTELSFDYRSKSIVNVAAHMMRDLDEEAIEDYLWYRMRITLRKEENSGEIIALFTVDGIHEEKEEALALRQQAETDPLTGALNRAAFAAKVDDHLVRGGGGTLYMFDLDNFKGINDNMGHSAGDVVLREVYAKIIALFRSDDLVGRVGGDEFVVFTLNTARESIIEQKAMAICGALHKNYQTDSGRAIEVSSSVGVSIAPRDGTHFAGLFFAADVAMYHSKNAGKNTYTLYSKDLALEFQPNKQEAYTRGRQEDGV